MTIILRLEPQEEAKLIAAAQAKGVSADMLLRLALDTILGGASAIPDNASAKPGTGTALVAAMEASPYREVSLEPDRMRLPIRDIVF